MKYQDYIKSDEWKRLRELCFSASGGRCEFCGDKAVNAHHVKYPKNFSEDKASNLVAVCRKCHELCHGIRKYNASGEESFLIRKAIALLLHDPSLAILIRAKRNFGVFNSTSAYVLERILDLLWKRPELNMAGLLESFRDTEIVEYINKIVLLQDMTVFGENPRMDFCKCIQSLELKLEEKRFNELRRMARAGVMSQDEKREFTKLISMNQGDMAA